MTDEQRPATSAAEDQPEQPQPQPQPEPHPVDVPPVEDSIEVRLTRAGFRKAHGAWRR